MKKRKTEIQPIDSRFVFERNMERAVLQNRNAHHFLHLMFGSYEKPVHRSSAMYPIQTAAINRLLQKSEQLLSINFAYQDNICAKKALWEVTANFLACDTDQLVGFLCKLAEQYTLARAKKDEELLKNIERNIAEYLIVMKRQDDIRLDIAIREASVAQLNYHTLKNIDENSIKQCFSPNNLACRRKNVQSKQLRSLRNEDDEIYVYGNKYSVKNRTFTEQQRTTVDDIFAL